MNAANGKRLFHLVLFVSIRVNPWLIILFARLLCLQLLEDRAHGRRERAVGRQAQVVFISSDCFSIVSGFFVSCAQQLIDDRFGIRELIDRNMKFARRQFVLTFVFINTSDAYVRFGLKAMAFAERAVERADRFVALRSFSVDAASTAEASA